LFPSQADWGVLGAVPSAALQQYHVSEGGAYIIFVEGGACAMAQNRTVAQWPVQVWFPLQIFVVYMYCSDTLRNTEPM